MRECSFFLFAFFICEILSMILPPETDCYNKGFICYDEDRFYQCVDVGDKTVTMGEPQFCPVGLKCSDNDEIECAEPWSAEDLKNTSTTTLKSNIKTDVFQEPAETTIPATNTTDESVSVLNTTDQFLVGNQTPNDTQTEEKEEFATEFQKFKITTDSVIKIPSLEGNEFLDVRTTKLPTFEDNGESLLEWKEPFFESEVPDEENIDATEVETRTSNVMTDAPENADYEYIYDFWNDEVVEETATTIVHGTYTTNEEQESITEITSNAEPSTSDLEYHEISLPATAEVLKSTVKEFETTPGSIPSISQSENFNFTTEQNEIFEVTLILETETGKTEAPVDDVRPTMSTQNTIDFHQTFQQENFKYTTTIENKLFTPTIASILTEEDSNTFESADNEDLSTQNGNKLFTPTIASILTEEDSKSFESADIEDLSTQNGDETTESKMSLLNYADSFIATDEYTISSTTSKTMEEFTPSAQVTSDHVEEMKTEAEAFRSDTDTTLLVESHETSQDCKTTESDLINNSKHNEQITSTQSGSTINSILNSTGTKVFEHVSTNAPTATINTVEDSQTTVTEEENGLHSFDTDSVISTDKEIKFVTTDWYISEDVDENHNFQSTLLKTNTENTSAETTLDNVSDTEEFRDENATEVMTRQTTDTTSRPKSEVFEEPRTINEISITPTYNTKTSASFTSGMFIEDDILYPLITETITVSIETDSFIDESNSKEATSFETGTSPLESEGLSSTQESILDADISTMTVKELDADIYNSYVHSTSSEVNTIDSSPNQENTTTKEGKLGENVTSRTIETSTYSQSDFYTTDWSSLANTIRGDIESMTDNKEIVEDDNNNDFTTTDTLRATEMLESSRTTDLPLTLSSQEISTNINNLVPSTEPEVTSLLTNYVNISIETDEDSTFHDKEVSTASLLSNTTEPVGSEEDTLNLPEFLSTHNNVTAPPSSSELPHIFTTHAEVSELSSNEFSSTIAPVPTFTCPSVGKFPDPKSCSKFYLCINAFVKYIAVALECPKGTQFDSAVKECTRRPVQCPGETFLTCTTSGVFPHPTDCSRYYKCLWRSFNKNFALKQFKCPRGTRYQSKNRCCERTSAAECANSFADDVSFKCLEVGRFAAEESCREYYECKEKSGKMTLYRKTCSESKLFDAEWGRCRKSRLVVCSFSNYDSRDTSEIDDRSVEYR